MLAKERKTKARHRAKQPPTHGRAGRSPAGSSHYWNVPERDREGRFVAGHEHDGGHHHVTFISQEKSFLL